jgi:Domain of unknown function (DUF4129)
MAALKKLTRVVILSFLLGSVLILSSSTALLAQDDDDEYTLDSSVVTIMLDSGAVSKGPKHIVYDSSNVVVRHMSDSAVNAYKKDPDFDYMSTHLSGESLYSRFMRWLARIFYSVGENRFWSAFLKILLYLGCGTLVIFAIIKIAGLSENAIRSTSGSDEGVDYSVTHDDIYAINFNEAIQKAIADKQYRFAVRLLYLKSLRGLADKELINWKINKTNYQYLSELESAAAHQPFKSLTRAYEYIWYGELPINESQFNELHKQFIHFSNSFT